MADLLVAAGYTTVFPDSLTPRGAVELCTQKTNERTVDQNQRRAGVLATLAWIGLQPWAKPDRIALLGWSHGGVPCWQPLIPAAVTWAVAPSNQRLQSLFLPRLRFQLDGGLHDRRAAGFHAG